MIRDPNLFAKFHLRSSVITYITDNVTQDIKTCMFISIFDASVFRSLEITTIFFM